MTDPLILLLAVLAGSAWRRWWGSERPGWAFPGYRGLQAFAGIAALFGFGLWTGEIYWRAALDAGLAVGFMTLPIRYSRRPFEIAAEWLIARGLPTTENLPHPWRPMLQGYAPWSEAIQGGALWLLAAIV